VNSSQCAGGQEVNGSVRIEEMKAALLEALWHRRQMVQARTRIMNQLQAVALNEGLRCKKRLWRKAGRGQLESFARSDRRVRAATPREPTSVGNGRRQLAVLAPQPTGGAYLFYLRERVESVPRHSHEADR